MKEEKLLHLLKKKRGFFEAMLDLAELELDVSISDWISILEQKKILLSCIEEIDKELLPFKESFEFLSQEIADELSDIKKTIQRLLHLDAVHQEKRKKELKITLSREKDE